MPPKGLKTQLSQSERSALIKLANVGSSAAIVHTDSNPGGGVDSIMYIGYPAGGVATTDEALWAIKRIRTITSGDDSTEIIDWAGADTERNKIFSSGGGNTCDYSGTFGFVNEV